MCSHSSPRNSTDVDSYRTISRSIQFCCLIFMGRCEYALILPRTISNPFNEQGNGSIPKINAINQSSIGFIAIYRRRTRLNAKRCCCPRAFTVLRLRCCEKQDEEDKRTPETAATKRRRILISPFESNFQFSPKNARNFCMTGQCKTRRHNRIIN